MNREFVDTLNSTMSALNLSYGIPGAVLTNKGFRYTPIDYDQPVIAGNEVYDWSQSFAKQFPVYHRFDLGINYQKNKPHWNWTISMHIYNVLNEQHIMNYELRHNDKTGEYSIAAVQGLGVVPNMNFQIQFQSES